MEAIGLGGDEIPAEGLVLNIDLPNFSEKQLGTRADATESINSLTAVFYGEGNTYIGMAKDPELTQKETGKYQVTISNIPAGTTTVHLVTNVNDLSEKEASDLQDIAKATSRTIDTSSPVCWGSISVKSLLEGNATVSLLRQYAKVTLKVADAVKGVFPEENAGLIIKHTAAKSAIAPVGYSDPTSDPTYALTATTEYSSTDVGNGTSREVAVTETPAGEANIIIKASYNGKDGFKDGFYKVALYKDDKKNSEYALLRNHNYTITITKVNDYGFSSLDEAINSKPENRIEAQIVDDNPAITKMIACKDYELGVSDDLSVKATAAVATEAIKATMDLCEKHHFNFYFEGNDYIYVRDSKDPVHQAFANNWGMKEETIIDSFDYKNIETYIGMIVVNSKDDIPVMVEALSPYFDVQRHQSDRSFDLTLKGSSKAVGIKELVKELGRSIDDTIAFGDGPNDVEMLQFAGTGVAMGNAIPAVKQYADMVTDKIDEDGLYHAFERLHLLG